MEISSHALDLRRADGIHVAVAVFTNLTQDHLDFHPDMEAYFQAKRLLFSSPLTRGADRQRRRRVRAPAGRGVPRHASPSRSTRAADYRAVDVRSGLGGLASSPPSRRTASSPSRIGLPGRFNVLNALGAWAAARRARRAGGGDRAALRRRRRACPGASSRSTRASRSRCSSTTRTRPDSLENALRAARELATGARDRRVRRRRRPRPRQAPADGRDRGARGGRGDRHLRQPALGGPGRDHRRDPRRHRGPRRASRSRRTAAPRSAAPSGSPRRATWS